MHGILPANFLYINIPPFIKNNGVKSHKGVISDNYRPIAKATAKSEVFETFTVVTLSVPFHI